MKQSVQTCGPGEREQAGQVLEGLVAFCRLQGPPWCYDGWPPELLREYLVFQIQQNALAYVLDPLAPIGQVQVIGLGIAWPCDEEELRAADGRGEHVCDWGLPKRNGDSIFLGDFIALENGVLHTLIRHLQKQWQGWESKKWFTYRKGKLTQINPALAAKMKLGPGASSKDQAPSIKPE